MFDKEQHCLDQITFIAEQPKNNTVLIFNFNVRIWQHFDDNLSTNILDCLMQILFLPYEMPNIQVEKDKYFKIIYHYYYVISLKRSMH